MDNRKPAPGTMIRRLKYIAQIHEAEASNANADVLLAREEGIKESSERKSNSLNQGSTERKHVPDVVRSQLYTKRLKQERVLGVEDRQLYSKKMREQSILEAKARWLIKDVKENGDDTMELVTKRVYSPRSEFSSVCASFTGDLQ